MDRVAEKSEFSLAGAFRRMALVRTFEFHLLDCFSRGELMGTTHTCLGQEANAVGVAAALRRNDVVVSNHRCHGHFLAHVGDMDGLMAEIMGKKAGVCGGWGGSQHLAVPGVFYSNGVQGGIAPLATGIALAEKWKETDRVVTAFLGDGTMGQGVVYESFNLAALHQVSMLIVIENNRIAQTTPTERTMAGTIEDRARAFAIPSERLHYPTVEEVYESTREAVACVRRGDGPFVLVIDSVRLGPHSKGDDTRSEDEIDAEQAKDPLKRTEAILPREEAANAWDQARHAVEQAYVYAKASPGATLDGGESGRENPPGPLSTAAILDEIEGKTFREQINQGLHRLMAERDDAIVLGEDILDPYGGAFKVTRGLSDAFPRRVVAAPISEAAMVGIAGGLALHGRKPVVEIMFGDFLGLIMDQLVNHLVHYRGMYDRKVEVPVVIRTPMGGRRGYGPSHSQTLDKHFLGMTDLRILAPSHLHPAGTMLRDAVEAPNPTLFIENKVLYTCRVERTQSNMVGDFFVRYDGDAKAPWLLLSLTDFIEEEVTLLCYGGMVPIAMDAARTLLMEEEIRSRIVAPSSLNPLDGSDLSRLIASQGAIVGLEEGSAPYGFGAEIAARLAEDGILGERTFARVAARERTIGAARTIEDAVLPQASDIVAAVLERV